MLFSAVGTIQAYQKFQQNHQRILSGDVSTVDSWMTLPYVARVYHVPEPCFYQSLNVSATWLTRHSTLRDIAGHYKRPVNNVIIEVRQVILNYRKHHTICGPPASPTPTGNVELLHRFPFAGRKGKSDE